MYFRHGHFNLVTLTYSLMARTVELVVQGYFALTLRRKFIKPPRNQSEMLEEALTLLNENTYIYILNNFEKVNYHIFPC